MQCVPHGQLTTTPVFFLSSLRLERTHNTPNTHPTGSQLEAGDLKGASSTLSSGGWVDDFKRATQLLDANDTEQARAAAIFDGISSLRDAASKGDVKGSKQTFVAVVSAVQDWAASTGLANDLKGL